jgi:hypothetical protein
VAGVEVEAAALRSGESVDLKIDSVGEDWQPFRNATFPKIRRAIMNVFQLNTDIYFMSVSPLK